MFCFFTNCLVKVKPFLLAVFTRGRLCYFGLPEQAQALMDEPMHAPPFWHERRPMGFGNAGGACTCAVRARGLPSVRRAAYDKDYWVKGLQEGGNKNTYIVKK